MLEHTDAYIRKTVDLGILTPSPFRKYPLRPMSLATVLKLYATEAGLPYDINNQKLKEIAHHKYYLTDEGLAWFYSAIKDHSIVYLRSQFRSLFATMADRDYGHLDSFPPLANFRGTVGDFQRSSKQTAQLVHTQGKRVKVYDFPTIVEARGELLRMSRFYPIEEFRLYRITWNKTKGRMVRIEIKLKETLL